MASGIWHLACQTYAQNLFQFHRSLNQTQFLFSSPRSFRVAKSETLSAGLSPRSRRLPLLFKFSGLPSLPSLPSLSGLLSLLRLFRFLKSALFFVLLLLLLSYSQSSVALTAYTSKYIVGSAPYLTFDNGRTKATSTDSLLSIRLHNGRVITPSTNTSSVSNPIKLPYSGNTLDDIDMIVPSSVSSVSISDLITRYNNWRDDDGDGQGANGVTATGNISVSFRDKDGNTVNRNGALDICKSPYRVTLSSTGGYLQTQYGVPNRTSFSGATVDYYINPYNSAARVCYARPNVNGKGFSVQSTSPSSYDRNFPTTGADGLYFDLDISGIDGSQLSWTVNTSGRLGAEVSWTRPRSGSFTDLKGNTVQADRWIPDKFSYVTRVTLSGPRADSAQINSNNPSPLDVPSLPQRFELVGRDSHGNEVRYGFVLKQWFVNRGGRTVSQSNQISWCSGLGYCLARVRDLTNAKCGVNNNWFPCKNGVDGAMPHSSDNYRSRRIDAGFFTEWGVMNGYADAGFVYDRYWTSDVAGSRGFSVASYNVNGEVVYRSASFINAAVCTVP
ncbi:hypothetical protein GA0061081_10455 [Gilliamella bombicola]|uniref:Uncharacterized protein n=1 Tax=Gilliamella bombicola TaxID=1798182 RepID=A0A1C4B9E0_9GAMM|nr:hypothetical protein [Gilliamella bombicola]SCC03404.1 hypothetical protein GA0061081_10455 [Gilliamella bombicola]